MNNPSDVKPTDYFANERTFLAWIRTAIGFMAMGFVVERFGFVAKQMMFLIENDQMQKRAVEQHNHAVIFGTALIIIGILFACIAFFNYRKNDARLKANRFETKISLAFILTLVTILIGIFLMVIL